MSTINSLTCTSKYFDGILTCQFTPQKAEYYNRINISFPKDNYALIRRIDLGKGETTNTQQIALRFTEDELAELYNRMTDTDTGTIRFTLRSYSDSGYTKEVGTPAAKDITLKIPQNSKTKPVLNINVSPVNEGVSDAFSDVYLEGISRIQHTNSVECKYGASIKEMEIRVGDTLLNPTYPIYQAGELSVGGYVIDTRGFGGTYESTIQINPYKRPKVVVSKCERCDKNGNYSDDGEYLHIVAKKIYSPVVVNDVQRNFCSLKYTCFYASGVEKKSEVILGRNSNDDEIDIILEGVVEDNMKSYSIKLDAIDDITGITDENSVTTLVMSERVDLHLGINKVAAGKYAEHNNAFEVSELWDFYLKGQKVVDFIVENGTYEVSSEECTDVDRGKWHYTKWNSGKVQFYGSFYAGVISSFNNEGLYCSSGHIIPFPFECLADDLYTMGTTTNGKGIDANVEYDFSDVNNVKATGVNFDLYSISELTNGRHFWVTFNIIGRWK